MNFVAETTSNPPGGMRFNLRCLVGLLAVLAGLPAALPESRAREAPPAERWVPPTTLAYLTLPNAARARTAWAAQPPGRLWADPAMQPFRALFETNLEQRLLAPLARLSGVHPGRLLGLAQGQITLVILTDPLPAPASHPPTSSVLLFLDVGNRTNDLAAQLASAPTLAPPRTELIVGGVSFVRVPLAADRLDEILETAFPRPSPPRAEPPGPKVLPLHFGTLGSWVLATTCTDTNTLAGILARLAGAPLGLAQHPSFVADAAGFTNTLAHGWLNVPPALGLFSVPGAPLLPAMIPGSAPGSGPSVDRVFAALGLKQLQSASFAVRADPDGWSTDLRLSVPVGERKGLFKLLQILPLDASPPMWVGADLVSLTRIRLPGVPAWTAFERLLRDIDPALLGVLQLFTQYAGRTEDADFDFDRGFIKKLGDDWLALSTRAPSSNAWGSKLLAHGSTNTSTLFHALTLIASPTYLSTFFPPGVPAPRKTEQVLDGRRVVRIELPSMPWRDGAPGTLLLASREDYVGISGTPYEVDRFVAADAAAPGLASQPRFTDALNRAGGARGGWVGYYLEREIARHAFTALRRSPQPITDALQWAAVSEFATRLVAGLAGWLDFDTLPAFEAVERHFDFRVESGRMDAAGFGLTTFRPTPPRPTPQAPPLPVRAPPK